MGKSEPLLVRLALLVDLGFCWVVSHVDEEASFADEVRALLCVVELPQLLKVEVKTHELG